MFIVCVTFVSGCIKQQENESKVITINDYLDRRSTDIKSGKVSPIDLPVSNVLQFFLEDGSKISVRPSGTEPKIKFYFSVFENLEKRGDFNKIQGILNERIQKQKLSLKLL